MILGPCRCQGCGTPLYWVRTLVPFYGVFLPGPARWVEATTDHDCKGKAMTAQSHDVQRTRGPVGPPPVTPACMTAAELTSWREVAGYVNNGTADPCSDCLPAFAAQMRSEDRCNGIPGLSRWPERLPDTAERVRGRRAHYGRVCARLGIEPAHAERVG